MSLTLDEHADLRRLWTEDCRVIVPDFELYDDERTYREIDRIRLKNNWHGLSDIVVVVNVIRALKEDHTEIPAAWWWITACLLILEDLESHPWMEQNWWVYNDMRGKREITTLWGSASVSKTAFFAAMVLTNMVVWHGVCHAYITCPFANAGRDKIYLEITRRVVMWAAQKPQWAEDLKLDLELNQGRVIVTNDDMLSSTCELVSLESVASVVGKKRSYLPGPLGKDKKTGALILVGDELTIAPAAAKGYLYGAGNLVANNNFIGFVGCNPLPHQIQHPECMPLSAPVDRSIDQMNEKQDFTWKTARGRLVRLCMDNSPNRHREEPIFPYLINKEQAAAAAKGGDQIYASMVAAWGWGQGMGNGGALSHDAVATPGWQKAPVWLKAPSRWLFVDLAFGGSDPAGYTAFEGGWALDEGKERYLISVLEQEQLQVTRTWKPAHADVMEFARLAASFGGLPPPLVADEEVGPNALMVLQTLRKASQLGVTRGMVAFDSSMRTDVTEMMRRALGHVPWYYSGNRPLKEEETMWPIYPPENNPDGTPAKWSEKHMEPISAFWRFAEHIISEGHVRNLEKAKRGTGELLARPWVQRSAHKKDVLGKKPLGMSPMWGETLALGLAFGCRFAGALPRLYDRKAIADGSVVDAADNPLFAIRGRRIARTW